MTDADDIVLEESTEDGDTGTAEQKLKVLRDRAKKAEAEASENLAGWQRAKADYINLQKRSREDIEMLTSRAAGSVLEELVPVFDSLEASAHDAVVKQLDQALLKLGVIRLRPSVGDVFNPAQEEAVQGVATDDKTKDNTVHSVLQSGYVIGGSIIRPARVIVYHYE